MKMSGTVSLLQIIIISFLIGFIPGCKINDKTCELTDSINYKICILYALPRSEYRSRHTILTKENFPFQNRCEYTSDPFTYFSRFQLDSVCSNFYRIIDDSTNITSINRIIQGCSKGYLQTQSQSDVKMVAFLFQELNYIPDTLCIYDNLSVTLNNRYLNCLPIVVKFIKMFPDCLKQNWIEIFDIEIDTLANDKNSVKVLISNIDTVIELKEYFR